MTDIVLLTLNARFAHASFGLRYLKANLGELRDRASIMEFTIADRPIDVIEAVLAAEPRIVGVGVYIWNARESAELVSMLKRVRPDITVVLGGPEVSYETEGQAVVEAADYVITGEADLTFPQVCEELLAGDLPPAKIIPGQLPKAEELALPYELYDSKDIAHRVIYVEASRGCPFRCEFCLSSLAKGVRKFPLEAFLGEMERLFERGVRHFKFVDRTFNLDIGMSTEILQFFLDRYEPGLFVHFEMVPDRLPEELREVIARFPAGVLQFEVGIQTFNVDVAKLISRRQDYGRLADNFRFLREETGVHLHADLIAGLPGEDMESFGVGFDRLVELGPQEIQVGILKRLRGTPIVRHDEPFEMAYGAYPPYEILETSLVDFATMQRIRRFARYWDMVGNSGNFPLASRRIWLEGSAFEQFMNFSDWLYAQTRRTHAIALKRLCALVFEYLTTELGQDSLEVAVDVQTDYCQQGRRKDILPNLIDILPKDFSIETKEAFDEHLPARQARHLTAS
ncbi:MAG: DUF4080 domain-containing protein [Bradymonadaceae bacterium]